MSMNFSGTIYDQIQNLEKRVSELERQLGQNQYGSTNDPNKCKTCGMTFGDGIYGYVCGHPKCPTKFTCFTS